MTLEEAYAITAKMHAQDHRSPTADQTEAKALIYDLVITPKFKGDPPPWAEPDYMEGWKLL